MSIYDACLLGGGVGSRFDPLADLPKQFQLILGKPVFVHAVEALFKLPIRRLYFVVPEAFISISQEMIQEHLPKTLPIEIGIGGPTRQESSEIALQLIHQHKDPDPTRVLVHDACRPYLSSSFLSRLNEILSDHSYPAWIPVIRVTDTLKRVEGRRVVETIDRDSLSRVQTPQIFDFELLSSLFRQLRDGTEAPSFSDDASICEYFGIPVGTFDGDRQNIKLTYPEEAQILSVFLENTSCDSALALTSID